MNFFKRRRTSSKKYGNRTAKGLDGFKYHSALEAAVSNIILADEKAGLCRLILRQQHIHFFHAGVKLCEYWPDFTVYDLVKKEIIWIEAKGMETTDWKIKLNLWRAGGPGRLFVYMGEWSRPKLTEIITPESPRSLISQQQTFQRLSEIENGGPV